MTNANRHLTGLRIMNTEATRAPEIRNARNTLVAGASSLADELARGDSSQTADGRPIYRGSTGKTEVDRVATSPMVEMVSHRYGEPGLHIGEDSGQPVVRLIERDDAGLSVVTVVAEDPLAASLRGGEYGPTVNAQVVTSVGFERLALNGYETDVVESWELTVGGNGDSYVREFPVPTEPRMAGVGGGAAGVPELEQGQGIVDRIHGIAFGEAPVA